MSFEEFKDVISKSEKKIASVLATNIGLGGIYAEEACLRAGVDKKEKASKITSVEDLFGSVETILGKIKGLEKKPAIVLGEEGYLDVIPFHLRTYEGHKLREFEDFNSAIDTFFSEAVFSEEKSVAEDKVKAKLKKILTIEQNQTRTVEDLAKKAVVYREIGDMIYQNLSALEELRQAIEKERNSGKSWDDINSIIAGKDFLGLKVLGVFGGKIKLEV